MDEYLDNTMEAEETYICKGCGEILEEGKAFELGMFNSMLLSHPLKLT
jgi:hypothetical protein